jgi:predicted ABC-class ATPase
MWKVSVLSDPLTSTHSHGSHVINSTISLKDLLTDQSSLDLFRKGDKTARVALADFVARQFIGQREKTNCEIEQIRFCLEPLDRIFLKSKRRKQNTSAPYPPYVLERSDFWCSTENLSISVRLITRSKTTNPINNSSSMLLDDEKKTEDNTLEVAVKTILQKVVRAGKSEYTRNIMQHVASVVLQHRIREKLASTKAVAFIANESILPRKSGTSDAPMLSPPAVPFKAPLGSSMSQTLTVEMSLLGKFLPSNLISEGSNSVSLAGLVVPAGITLICGGGYHGKSTMLQTIAFGIYNKIPGDGREFCVSVLDAVTVVSLPFSEVSNHKLIMILILHYTTF